MSITIVRTLITDNPTDANGVVIATDQVFTDAEIESFISLAGGNLDLAAVRGLRVLAANDALVLKKVSVEGEDTDGPAVAEALRKIALDIEFNAQAPAGSVW